MELTKEEKECLIDGNEVELLEELDEVSEILDLANDFPQLFMLQHKLDTLYQDYLERTTY